MDYKVENINATILEHMMNPQNYGKIENNSCCGIGLDEKSGEFVIMYLLIKDGIIDDIKFSTNGCQDTVVAGSLFTEMVKKDTLKNGIRSCLLMKEKIKDAPLQQKACTSLVLIAFDGAVENLKNRTSGIDEEFFTIKLDISCDIDESTDKSNQN